MKMFACAMMLLQTIGISVVEKGLIHIDQYTQEQFSALLAEDSHLMFLAGMGSVPQLLGGIAVPLFAFLLVEGFLHTSDVTGPLAFYGIWCYNEVRTDRIPRYAYYLFYPLHLLALGLISVLVCVSSCS